MRENPAFLVRSAPAGGRPAYGRDMQPENAPAPIFEITLQGVRDGRKSQLVPGNVLLPEQANLQGFVAGAEMLVQQPSTKQHVDLADVRKADHGVGRQPIADEGSISFGINLCEATAPAGSPPVPEPAGSSSRQTGDLADTATGNFHTCHTVSCNAYRSDSRFFGRQDKGEARGSVYGSVRGKDARRRKHGRGSPNRQTRTPLYSPATTGRVRRYGSRSASAQDARSRSQKYQ